MVVPEGAAAHDEHETGRWLPVYVAEVRSGRRPTHVMASVAATVLLAVTVVVGLALLPALPAPAEGTASMVRTPVAVKPVAQMGADVAPRPAGNADLHLGDPYYPGTWDALAQCQADGRWSAPPQVEGGPAGGLGLSDAEWTLVGGSGSADTADRAEQMRRAMALWDLRGWAPWAACADALGWH